MSISSVSSSSAYTDPTTYTDPANTTSDTYTDPANTTASDTSDDANDWNSFWAQFDKDCCDNSMSYVSQTQAQEKKNDQEVYHQDG